MVGVRGDIKIHDSGEGDNQEDDQKEVKLKAQTLHGWQDSFREYSLHRVLHLFILQKVPRRQQEHLRKEMTLAYFYYI
jgi:hypothetical protein